MNNQRLLERRLVETLRENGDLEDAISYYGIENIRVCSHCGKLMNEGWMYDGRETYCSDRCLQKANPCENLHDLRLHASDDDSDTYWTRWE